MLGEVAPQKPRQRRELVSLRELRYRRPKGNGCRHCRPGGKWLPALPTRREMEAGTARLTDTGIHDIINIHF